jgi:hypothetical protein
MDAKLSRALILLVAAAILVAGAALVVSKFREMTFYPGP